ncbi:hypothetical protein FOZ63_009402, partial [Perkinsus olseni]
NKEDRSPEQDFYSPESLLLAREEAATRRRAPQDTSQYEAKLVFRPEEGFDEVTLEDLRLRPAHHDSSTATGSTGKAHLYVGRVSPSRTNIRDRMTYQYKVPLRLVPDIRNPFMTSAARGSRAFSIGLDHGYAASGAREDGHDYALPPPPHREEGNRGAITE